MRRLQLRKGWKAFLLLLLFSAALWEFQTPAFAKSGLTLSCAQAVVNPGDTVTVSVHLSGENIWAYDISLSGNEVFAGGKQFVEDYDGGSDVYLTCEFFAMIPGTGVIYAEGSYSDGETLKQAGQAELQIEVQNAEPSEKGREGTGGQAAPGQPINGETAPEAPEPPKQGTDAPQGVVQTPGGTGGETPTEEISIPAESRAAETGKEEAKADSQLRWILPVGICVVLALVVLAAVVVIRKKNRHL